MAAEDTIDTASMALLHRLRAGATVHFVHNVDVCSAAPEDLVAGLEPVPDTSIVWYFWCIKKYKSARGRPGGHRQRAIAASDTCWHSEGGAKEVKGSEEGGTVCNLSYGRKNGRSFSRLGWCMMEYDDATGGGDYVLCRIYRSPRAQGKPAVSTQQDAFFTDVYAMPSTVAQVNVTGEEEQHLSAQDGEFVETSYGLLPSDVAQVNVEEWVRGMEMFGGEEEQQSSKMPEQDDGSVKVAPLVTEDNTVDDCLLALETTSGEASGVPLPATFTSPDDIFDALERDSALDDLQEQSLQMQQPHATEPDPMAEAARADLETPYAAAMTLTCQLQESDWMMHSFLQAYPSQLPYSLQFPCLMY